MGSISGASHVRQTDRQTDRQTNRHTHTHTHTQGGAACDGREGVWKANPVGPAFVAKGDKNTRGFGSTSVRSSNGGNTSFGPLTLRPQQLNPSFNACTLLWT